MSTWFHNDPAGGRLGPFTTEGLLERYRNRLIQGDTLVWREGLSEWLPLERVMADADRVLGAQPPPLPAQAPMPPGMGQPSAHRHHPAAQTRPPLPAQPGGRAAAPRKQGMSGCLIALIVVAALAIPMMAILAAIALPAYRDYTVKAKVYQAIAQSVPVQEAIVAHVGRTGSCPADGDPGFEDSRRFATPLVTGVTLDTRAEDGACTYAMVLPFAGDASEPATAVMAMGVAQDRYVFEFDCQASTLRQNFQPASCRTHAEDSQ